MGPSPGVPRPAPVTRSAQPPDPGIDIVSGGQRERIACSDVAYTTAGDRSSFAWAPGAKPGRRFLALSTAKPVTASTEALPSASIVRLSAEDPGDVAVATAAARGGAAKSR